MGTHVTKPRGQHDAFAGSDMGSHSMIRWPSIASTTAKTADSVPHSQPKHDQLGCAGSVGDMSSSRGYFYVRLYWTGFGLPANIVEDAAPPVGLCVAVLRRQCPSGKNLGSAGWLQSEGQQRMQGFVRTS
eukprot:15481441-Alexandrium_andersonii.AAC.1